MGSAVSIGAGMAIAGTTERMGISIDDGTLAPSVSACSSATWLKASTSISGPSAKIDAGGDDVFQLANVARPAVPGEQRLGGRRERTNRRTAVLRHALEEVLGQARQVVEPVTQRRQLEHHALEPVVEVGAEAAITNRCFEVAVGRADDAHVDLDRLRAAHALELAFLQHPQQRDLGPWG